MSFDLEMAKLYEKMEINILDKLNITFKALSDQSCSDEDRKNLETFLSEIIQNPESILTFIQFLHDDSYSEQSKFFAFAGVKKMIKHHWSAISEESKNQIIENLLPFIFIPTKVASQIRDLFYTKIKGESFLPLWTEIFSRCKNELSEENVSIEKVEAIMQNVFQLSELIKSIYRSRPVDSEFLIQFNEITAPFFDNDLIQSENGLSILINSIWSIVNLFGRSIATSCDDFVDQRVAELCQFLLKLYEAFNSISNINDQQLNFLQSCSSGIYSLIISIFCRADIKVYNEEEEEIQSEICQSILCEWKPQMLSLIFDLCISIFNSDQSKHFQISKIIRPLTIDNESTTSFIESFFVPAFHFVSIPADELQDFFNFPDIYYQSQYITINDKYGNLRNNATLIYQNIFEHLNLTQIDYLFQNIIQFSEPEVFIVAKNAKCIINKGASNILYKYMYYVLVHLHDEKTDIFYIPTVLYFFSKSIDAVKFNFIPQLIQSNLTILEHFEIHKNFFINIMLSVHFFYRLKKSINKKIEKATKNGSSEIEWRNEMVSIDDVRSIFPDETIMEILFKIIEIRAMSDIFKLIELIAKDHEEIYPQLAVLYEHILNGIMVEVENVQSIDSKLMLEKSQMNMMHMFSFLQSLIEHNSDTGIEEELFKVLSACLKVTKQLEISQEILNVITALINLKSETSILYLKRILSYISINGEDEEEEVDNSMFRKSILNFSIPFISFMSIFPSEFFESGLLIETYKTLINLMKEEVTNDAFDDFGLVALLIWIFQLQPQIIGNESEIPNSNPTFFLEYLESRKDRDEDVMESAMMNLALTFILLEKIDFSEDFAERWLNFIKSHKFLRNIDVQFHLIALRFLISNNAFAEFENEKNLNQLAKDMVDQMQSNQISFINKDKCKVVIKMPNLDYPIFSLINNQS